MTALRVDCPACVRDVALTVRGRLYKHGRPECALSRSHLGRIWPAKYRGRRVRTVPGPDTWNPPDHCRRPQEGPNRMTTSEPQLADPATAQENIATAATVLRGELGRSDTKASVLLGLTGAALLGTAATALDFSPPLGTAVVRCLGVAAFFVATVFLLLAVFPSLSGPGWPAWCRLSTDELRARLMAGHHQVEEVHALALSAAGKFRRIQYAVICDLAGLGFTAVSAVLGGAL